eukprot:scaffold11035_cov39-Isochrysis_galbana.AAC.1
MSQNPLAHLDPGVHLDEVVPPLGIDQELDGARIEVVCALHQPKGIRVQLFPERHVQRPGGRDLNHLLYKCSKALK